ncbi:MAG: acetolactate synthase small subunit [Gammaproteobacteria bacterium]|jgi:acetolactate synthase-1/3 small subunit|nr:acetolactate synthase small subunit [Gammaproteobacteria bacterium]MBT3490293.1 acetolactate synthase small subunit [Gammaproteobacteria bacterium]MBT3717630.1 acetolactate synthase small subunit [Gammaproteobacteria bacterium]MBT3843577.1 acetolactate synthase small subunit [Gammaproteobacteria bacterium]MBT3893819.1 acetolactate synthase small subunit [Gammaproteobacteria bacterium]
MSRHIISILLENEAGALSRVAGLFSARGYNIEMLTVAPTHDATLSRMTLVTSGTEAIIEQINKQLNKLVDVVTLVDLTEGQHIERELVMIKISTEGLDCDQVHSIVTGHGADVVDESEETCVVELLGNSQKIDALIASMEPLSIKEVVRSGVSGIKRGADFLTI